MNEVKSELSEREIEILKLVATGLSNKEIAARVYISPNTVKVHLRNIFEKIGVASRTEATLYAIRSGFVSLGASSNILEENEVLAITPTTSSGNKSDVPVGSTFSRHANMVVTIGLIFLGLILALLGWISGASSTSARPDPTVTSTIMRWENEAAFYTARRGFAVVTYDGQIYSIGGETEQGITTSVDRYNTETKTWETLNPLPVAMADLQAVTLGGKIYVRGGRTATGKWVNILFVFDPQLNKWDQESELPITMANSALVTFEGKFYFFGAWDEDGQQTLPLVYEYNPDIRRWKSLTQMPATLTQASAAVIGEKIYLIGNFQNKDQGNVLFEYSPNKEGTNDFPWRERATHLYKLTPGNLVSIADSLYVYTFKVNEHANALIKYSTTTDTWQDLGLPTIDKLQEARIIAVSTQIHLLGEQAETPSKAIHLRYNVTFSIFLPVIAPGLTPTPE